MDNQTELLKLDGKTPQFEIGDAGALGLRDCDFTVEAWILMNDGDPPDMMVMGTGPHDVYRAFPIAMRPLLQQRGISIEQLLYLGVMKRRLVMDFEGLGQDSMMGRTELRPGIWHHVAFRYKKDSKEMALLVNGVVDTETASREAFKGTGTVYIGRRFLGTITEVRIWNTARTVNEIRGDMLRRRAKGSVQGLIACFPLLKDDSSGAKLVNPAWVKLQAPLQRTANERPPAIPIAIFDGASSRVRIPVTSKLAMKDRVTLEAWIRPTGRGQIHQHPVISSHGGHTGWELRCGDGKGSLMVTTGAKHQEAVTDKIELDQWIHLAGVYDGNEARLYVNGVLKETLKFSGQISVYQGDAYLGNNPNFKRYFAGQIGDARIWDRARSAEELQATLFVRLTGKEPGLVGYWRLDDGAGSPKNTAADSSPTPVHGTYENVNWGEQRMPLAMGGIVAPGPHKDAIIAGLIRERDDLNSRLANLKEVAGDRESKFKLLKMDIEMIRQDKQTLEAEKKALEGRLQKQEDEMELEIKKQVKALRDGVSLSELIQKTNAQITEARKELTAKGAKYRLGRVSVELRMLPADDGTSIVFPKAEQLEKMSQLSTVNFDFASEETAEEQPREVSVPDVTGYTELLAHRKLSEAGFTMEVNYQAVTVPEDQSSLEPSREGRVIMQFPRANDNARPSSPVAVFIGKRS